MYSFNREIEYIFHAFLTHLLLTSFAIANVMQADSYSFIIEKQKIQYLNKGVLFTPTQYVQNSVEYF